MLNLFYTVFTHQAACVTSNICKLILVMFAL